MTFERELAQLVSLAVKTSIAPLLERIAVLEARAPIPGPPGERGADGRDGNDGADGANGKDGTNGIDGKDGAPGLNGKDGIDGKDGAPGLNGKDGAPGADGTDGKDGAPGLHGKDGANGKDGAPGLNGKDGVGLMDCVIDRAGHLIQTFSDGRTKDVGLIVGKDGAPGLNGKDGANGLDGKDGAAGLNGKDGAPGIGFDDLHQTFTKELGHCLEFARGDQRTVIRLFSQFDAGVWAPGLYPQGACVTQKGNYWMALEDTRVQPGLPTPESNKAWRLIVRAGKDGKPGRDGRDLT